MIDQRFDNELPKVLVTCDNANDSDDEDYSVVDCDNNLTSALRLGQKEPSFENVSVSNSTDIHFGNNTFFQGPVTIQQLVCTYPSVQGALKDALPKDVTTGQQLALPQYFQQFDQQQLTTKGRPSELNLCCDRGNRRRQCLAWIIAATLAVLITSITYVVITRTVDDDDKFNDYFDYDDDNGTIPAANLDGFQTEPRRVLAKPGESVIILGRAGAPLSKCQFYLPQPKFTFLDFSLGRKSRVIDKYSYYGRGLHKGECGIKYWKVDDDDDGIVECKVTLKATNKLESCVTTLRVTDIPKEKLPVFEISPRIGNLSTGDNITYTCNTVPPMKINMCHIYLPGPIPLNYDRGHQSQNFSTSRYFGTGLENGQCGVTLTGVDTRLNGYVVCKVGQWPEQVTGAWETDALKVTTSGELAPGLRTTVEP